MASNFRFQAFGLSQAVTVGASPSTVSLSVLNNTTVTQMVAGGTYQTSAARMVNLGSVAVFINFYPSTTVSISVSVTNGMALLPNTDRSFGIRGQPVLAIVSAGTTTVQITPGEGMNG